MHKFILILMTVFLASCSSYHECKTSNVKTSLENFSFSKKIYVDSSFSQDELLLIKQAATNITDETNHIATIQIADGFDLKDKNSTSDPDKYFNKTILKKSKSTDGIIKKIDEKINEDNESEDQRRETLGYFLDKGSFEYIFIVSDRLMKCKGSGKSKECSLYKEMFLSTVMHEMLHSLDMSHDDKNGASIMNVQFEMIQYIFTGNDVREPITCMTKADAKQFCNLYVCEYERLSYCGK